MVTKEGAAHFFLGPQTKNFVISCWYGLNGTLKNWALSKTKNDPFITHSYYNFQISLLFLQNCHVWHVVGFLRSHHIMTFYLGVQSTSLTSYWHCNVKYWPMVQVWFQLDLNISNFTLSDLLTWPRVVNFSALTIFPIELAELTFLIVIFIVINHELFCT